MDVESGLKILISFDQANLVEAKVKWINALIRVVSIVGGIFILMVVGPSTIGMEHAALIFMIDVLCVVAACVAAWQGKYQILRFLALGALAWYILLLFPFKPRSYNQVYVLPALLAR